MSVPFETLDAAAQPPIEPFVPLDDTVERSASPAVTTESPFMEAPSSAIASSPSELYAKALSTLQQANTEAERIFKAAHSEGYSAGYKAGQEASIEEAARISREGHARLSEQVDQFLADVAAQIENYFEQGAQQITELALAIAQKVIKERAEAERDMALRVAKDAIRRLGSVERLTIRVNPADLEHVRSEKRNLLSVMDSARQIDVIEDRRVEPGGAVIECENGIVDARISVQVGELERALSDREAA